MPGGAVVEPVAAFLREAFAARSIAGDVAFLRHGRAVWWRFLGAVDVGWHRATRIEARDFSCWIQLAVKHPRRPLPDRVVATVESVGPPNPVTGKHALGPG
ncbi:MAG TPA: integrase, partial [Mycobacterium sp.]|nr:integrase [Mycobacterium sp.]